MQTAMSDYSGTNCHDRTIATVCATERKDVKWDNAMQHHV